jgi:nitroreductase
VDLDLVATLRSTGAARQFHPEPIADDVLERLLDTARFAPSGGNRQGWRVIVVKDPPARVALRDIYLSGWYEYLALVSAGLVPWAPVSDRDAEAAAIVNAPQFAEAGAAAPGFPETLDTAPALLLVLADLRALFDIPDTVAVAALVVLGRPVAAPRKLKRAPVEAFAWVDRYGGTPLGGS